MKLLQKTSTPLRVTALLFLLASSISSVSATADELAIPVGHQGADKTSLERPKVGMTSAAVETRFGAPLSKTTPVGQPPISSWDYPHYSVYFESDRVLHSVLKPLGDETTAPDAVVAPAAVEVAPVAEPVPTAVTDPVPAPTELPEAAK